MGGRRSPHDKDKRGGREQAGKQVRGFARGHGAHHRYRPGKDAPRQLGSGRDRTQEGTRQKSFDRMSDDSLADINLLEKKADVERRVEAAGDSQSYGARMEGIVARGLVLEVRKGNFLTRMLTAPEEISQPWKQGDVLRTFVRGTMQQFDLGLSSVVAPGDEIEVIVPPQSGPHELYREDLHATLTKVQPRHNEFRRVHPSGRAVQTLAANIDRVFVVASTAEPDFRPGFVDRVLVCAAASGIPAALILNKIDLGIPKEDEELLDVYRSLGLPIFKISARTTAESFRGELPELPGASSTGAGDLQALREALAGRRSLLTGHSGVGKSTLLLALDSTLDEALVRTGEVSTQTQKGTHTTTHAHLFSLNLGAELQAEVIDTPGVREFTPADTDRQNLWGWFPELVRLQGQCAYADCTHTIEKGCAVLEAVKRGEIHPRRHQSYVRIHETLPA